MVTEWYVNPFNPIATGCDSSAGSPQMSDHFPHPNPTHVSWVTPLQAHSQPVVPQFLQTNTGSQSAATYGHLNSAGPQNQSPPPPPPPPHTHTHKEHFLAMSVKGLGFRIGF